MFSNRHFKHTYILASLQTFQHLVVWIKQEFQHVIYRSQIRWILAVTRLWKCAQRNSSDDVSLVVVNPRSPFFLTKKKKMLTQGIERPHFSLVKDGYSWKQPFKKQNSSILLSWSIETTTSGFWGGVQQLRTSQRNLTGRADTCSDKKTGKTALTGMHLGGAPLSFTLTLAN